jgi:hypothetical protein
MLEAIGGIVGGVGALWFLFGMVAPGKALPYGSPSRWKVAGVAFLVMGLGGAIQNADPEFRAKQAAETQAKVEEEAAANAAARRRLADVVEARREAEANRKPDLELISFEHERAEYGNGSIGGTVKNNSGKDYSYVQITFELLDEDDNTIGTALANVGGLRAEATWKYKAAILQDGMRRYRLQELTGF